MREVDLGRVRRLRSIHVLGAVPLWSYLEAVLDILQDFTILLCHFYIYIPMCDDVNKICRADCGCRLTMVLQTQAIPFAPIPPSYPEGRKRLGWTCTPPGTYPDRNCTT